MAPRKPKVLEIVETDRLEGRAHPRETYRLAGQDAALARASAAIRSGRPPQAWLISGPPGIGKATLAYRIARYLLAFGATDKGPADLSVGEKDPAAIQVAAGSHPGLLVLKRGVNPDTGRLMSVLAVDEVRKLAGFFGMTSGAGGWRVAIVDTADDMNDNAANALLKMLEEPPARAMLLLLAHVPGRLLPTIRSRCKRLDLRPLEDSVLDAELARVEPELKAKERDAIVHLAGGSLGLALQLAGGDGVAIAEEAERLLDQGASADVAAVLSLADKLGRITDGLDQFGAFLAQAMEERIRKRAQDGAKGLDRWVECLSRLNNSFARTGALHLDPRQTLLSASRALSATARRAGTIR